MEGSIGPGATPACMWGGRESGWKAAWVLTPGGGPIISIFQLTDDGSGGYIGGTNGGPGIGGTGGCGLFFVLLATISNTILLSLSSLGITPPFFFLFFFFFFLLFREPPSSSDPPLSYLSSSGCLFFFSGGSGGFGAGGSAGNGGCSGTVGIGGAAELSICICIDMGMCNGIDIGIDIGGRTGAAHSSPGGGGCAFVPRKGMGNTGGANGIPCGGGIIPFPR